jgi:uncharacterized protein (DUF1778 family)
MSTDPDPPTGRRRTYVFPGRQKRLSIRVTDDEDAEIANAANQLGLTPTGFCAHAALDAARNLNTDTTERMEHETLANLQAELFQARITLNQLRVELARHHDTSNHTTADGNEIITRAARSIAGLDNIISRVHRRLAQR